MDYDQIAEAILASSRTEYRRYPQPGETVNVADALFEVADALKEIAHALDRLGNGDAMTSMGAMEAHGKTVSDAIHALAQASSDKSPF
jgi:hypothetical protein